MTTFRELAVRWGEGEARKGVREVGGNNRGPRVSMYQGLDGLKIDPDTGYPWCASFVVAGYELVGRPLVELHESASVGLLLGAAGKHGWVVSKPLRGDLVCFFWGGSGDSWPDHIGFVRGVKGSTLLTVEGNTSSGRAGSQDDGDGVFMRERSMTAIKMRYIRVPGEKENPDKFDYDLIRGRAGNRRVVAHADTLTEALKEATKQFGKGAWGVEIRKRVEK